MIDINMDLDLLLLISGALISIVIVMAFWNKPTDVPGMKKRMARVTGDAGEKDLKTEARRDQLKRRTSDSEIALFDIIIKRALPNPEKLRSRLAQTGTELSLGEYLIINALCIMVTYLILLHIAEWSTTTSVLCGIALGLWLPYKIINRMARKRIQRFLSNFPDAIDTICRGLRSGLPIAETMATVGHELPNPIGIEFTRISDGVRMGRNLEDAIWEVMPRVDTPEFRFFVIALAIQKETGGNLAETLGNLGDLIRKRHQLALKIKAMSSEARASAMIIGSLPFVMFSLLMFVNSEYMMILLNDLRGQVLTGIGLGWLGLGVFVMKQMISFEI